MNGVWITIVRWTYIYKKRMCARNVFPCIVVLGFFSSFVCVLFLDWLHSRATRRSTFAYCNEFWIYSKRGKISKCSQLLFTHDTSNVGARSLALSNKSPAWMRWREWHADFFVQSARPFNLCSERNNIVRYVRFRLLFVERISLAPNVNTAYIHLYVHPASTESRISACTDNKQANKFNQTSGRAAIAIAQWLMFGLRERWHQQQAIHNETSMCLPSTINNVPRRLYPSNISTRFLFFLVFGFRFVAQKPSKFNWNLLHNNNKMEHMHNNSV